MIRTATPAETSHLLEIARATALFMPWELESLQETLDEFHAGDERRAMGHRLVTCEEGDEPVGFAYFAPAAMTEGTWYLSWMAVAPEAQGRGFGSSLLRVAEEDIRLHQGRLLLIELPSTPLYERARRFYAGRGYERDAALRDYYADGQDLLVLRKRLLTPDRHPV